MADILADLQAIVRTGGDTYSSAEVLAVVKRAAGTVEDLLGALKALHANCTAADEFMRAAEFVIAKAEGRST